MHRSVRCWGVCHVVSGSVGSAVSDSDMVGGKLGKVTGRIMHFCLHSEVSADSVAG